MNHAFLDSLTSGKSIVVSGAFFESDARWIELVIMGLAVLALAWGAASLFAAALDLLLKNAGRARRLRDTISRRGPLVTRFKKRCAALVEKVNIVNDQLEEVQAARAALYRKLRILVATRDQLVRQIGDNTDGTSCFRFLVANRYVLAAATKGQTHPMLDESWKSPQLVEVWAESPAEAVAAISERYPVTFGYVIGKANGEDGAKGKAKAKPRPKPAVASAR